VSEVTVMVRSSALMMHEVMVPVNPYGLPIATTVSPTLIVDQLSISSG
jgi:hypothetical protein